jgi:hypothetical protein
MHSHSELLSFGCYPAMPRAIRRDYCGKPVQQALFVVPGFLWQRNDNEV